MTEISRLAYFNLFTSMQFVQELYRIQELAADAASGLRVQRL